MNSRTPRPTMVCRNCGGDIHDGYSPTGLVHVATERARCDGQKLPTGTGHKRFIAAVTTDLAVQL